MKTAVKPKELEVPENGQKSGGRFQVYEKFSDVENAARNMLSAAYYLHTGGGYAVKGVETLDNKGDMLVYNIRVILRKV